LFDANNETIVSNTTTSINIYHLVHYILSRLGMHSILFLWRWVGKVQRCRNWAACLVCFMFAVVSWTKLNQGL